jgi:copper(I)-binding protein
VTVGDLTLSGAFTRATLPNAPVGGGYVTITNNGTDADRLIGAESVFSPDVQVHEMAVIDDVMQMSQLPDGLEIPAGETVTLAPGGLHLMFMQISQPFVEGETVPVTLTFEHAGEIEIELAVEAFGASSMSDHSEHEGH